MGSRPVIGIITSYDFDPHYLFPGYPRLTLNVDYPRSVTAAGGVAMLLPPLEDRSALPQQLAMLDGLIMAGGADVDPLLYGQPPAKECQAPSPVRDAFELEALTQARSMGVPVFGICRGMQMINVFLGGTLFQDLRYANTDQLHMGWANPAYAAHRVEVTPGSFLEQVWGERSRNVNSFHHQALDVLGEGLQVAARAQDGLVEAVWGDGDFDVHAVQWHPEMMSGRDAQAQALFDWFVHRAAQRTPRKG